MLFLLYILMPIGLLVILGILTAGIVGLFRGASPQRSNKLMQYRVIAQFAVLILLLLFALVARR